MQESRADRGPTDPEPVCWGLKTGTWIQVLVLVLAMAALFWPNLRRLWIKTRPFYGEPNWQHSMIVPLIGLYYLYINREALWKAEIKPLLPRLPGKTRLMSVGLMVGAATVFLLGSMVGLIGDQAGMVRSLAVGLMIWAGLALTLDWGVGTILVGLLAYAYGIFPGQNDFLKDLGMVITLFGVVLTLLGWEVMRIAWFPIAFLVCALPWPPLVYSWVAGPLQSLAAGVAVKVLSLTGVMASREGTKILIGIGSEGRMLNVAEACAGLRSLMTFISVAAALAFLSARPLWQRLIITASAVPIAICCNVMRVSGQGLLDTYWSREVSEGFAHQFVGLFMMVPAFFLILLVGWLLDRIFIDEVADKAALAARKAAKSNAGLVIELPRRAAPVTNPPPVLDDDRRKEGAAPLAMPAPPPPTARLARKRPTQ